MTADATQSTVAKNKDTVSKKDDKSKEKKDKELPPTKVVIRRLPPSLTAETFLEQISPVPDHNYINFVTAEKELGPAAFSRAYINFDNAEDVFIFTEKFDNYIFVDSKGNEFPAIVEYAPFQKVPKNKSKKADSRKGTIENDADYLKFKESLENPTSGEAFTPENILEEIENREKQLKANHGVLKMSTPLLDYIKKKKEEKKQANFKLREERKKREEERRKKRDEERKKKRDRERERLRDKEERQRQRDREKDQSERHRDRDRDSSQPMKLLVKQEKEDGYSKVSKRSDGDNISGNLDRKYDSSRPRTNLNDGRGKEHTDKDLSRDAERRERERRRREREDEEERKWQERERDRRERRDKERRDREKKERERRERDRERREKDRRERDLLKEQDQEQEKDEKPVEKEKHEEVLQSEPGSKSAVDKAAIKDPMIESTSSIEEQPSSSSEAPDKQRDGESRGQRQRARYKDRPERQIYNPGQRAAERRKQMEAKAVKDGTPEPYRGEIEKTESNSNSSSRRNSVGSSHSPRD